MSRPSDAAQPLRTTKRLARAEVDLGALVRNYARGVDAAAPADVAAVVKADAYGLGVAAIAPALARAGCRRLFVATLAEGIELRRILSRLVGEDYEIFVLDGPTDDDTGPFIRERLVPVLNSPEQAGRWDNAGPAAVHVDTGMNRLGFGAAELIDCLRQRTWLADAVLILTHLACADEPGHAMNDAQPEDLAAIRSHFGDTPVSIGNSAGALLGPAQRGDVVRAGIALYGGNPFVTGDNPMEPVVTLSAPVIQVRTLERAGTVGYGASFAGRAGMRIATIGAGYADGYPRSLGNRGFVFAGGARAPVVGRVSMDLTCVDVSALEPGAVCEGDMVELFGRNVTIDEVADAAGTISYELLTRLGGPVRRCYVEDGREVAVFG